jgi:NAD(P)-dependent dehydrogenase (short-subunit alcohol dehydrogenase family)
MEWGLQHKVVVITGGTAGIGKAAAEAFAAEGARVALCGRRQEKIETMEAEFKQRQWPLYTEAVDVSDLKALKSFAENVKEHYGSVDIWINNAGAIQPLPFDELAPDEWDVIVNTNLKAVYYGSAFAARLMTKKGGVIINTSSFSSVVPSAGKALYAATKAAVESLTRTMAAELASRNIRVVSIIPGYIRTAFTEANIARNFDHLIATIPMKRIGEPKDMVGAYLFLASDAASYVNGVSLIVSGAKCCVQNPLWSWEER